MKSKLFILISFVFVITNLQAAYDFYALNSDGVRIYYSIQAGSGNRVMVEKTEGTVYTGIINIPDSVTYEGETYAVAAIGEGAFAGSGITVVSIPDSVKTIREYAFAGCYNLTDIIIPDGVTTIRNDAFRECKSLKNVSFGKNISTIGSWAFYGCSKLESIILSDKVTTIDFQAFLGCSGLKSITLSESLTEISDDVFAGCSSLESILLVIARALRV